MVTDVTREAQVAELVRRAARAHGRVDIYCSNAGVASAGGAEVPDRQWQRSWEVHVMAHVYAARAVLPAMLERGEGYFVGTASAAALLNHIASAPYAVTKAATLSFLEWLAITPRIARRARVGALSAGRADADARRCRRARLPPGGRAGARRRLPAQSSTPSATSASSSSRTPR